MPGPERKFRLLGEASAQILCTEMQRSQVESVPFHAV
jgi:hypothetical protein